MDVTFDPQTLERFRRLTPREAYEQARELVYRSGAHSSDDFLDVIQALVDADVLSWEQIEDFDR